jgi:hypothetical protein
MMQLFKQFGITQFDFTSVKGHDRVDIILVKLVMNIFEVKTRTNDASAFTYSTVIEKSKLEFILNEKNIKHQPLVFSLKLVIAGFKDYQIKYTILVLKPKQIKQQHGNTEK